MPRFFECEHSAIEPPHICRDDAQLVRERGQKCGAADSHHQVILSKDLFLFIFNKKKP
jgi:hypothetical protein